MINEVKLPVFIGDSDSDIIDIKTKLHNQNFSDTCYNAMILIKLFGISVALPIARNGAVNFKSFYLRCSNAGCTVPK